MGLEATLLSLWVVMMLSAVLSSVSQFMVEAWGMEDLIESGRWVNSNSQMRSIFLAGSVSALEKVRSLAILYAKFKGFMSPSSV